MSSHRLIWTKTYTYFFPRFNIKINVRIFHFHNIFIAYSINFFCIRISYLFLDR